MAPAVYETAGRSPAAGPSRGNKWLEAMLIEAAGSVSRTRSKNYLASQYARISRRRVARQGQVRVAHSIWVIA